MKMMENRKEKQDDYFISIKGILKPVRRGGIKGDGRKEVQGGRGEGEANGRGDLLLSQCGILVRKPIQKTGYIREYPMERHVRDTRVHQILEGTNEIMRVIVARHMLAAR